MEVRYNLVLGIITKGVADRNNLAWMEFAMFVNKINDLARSSADCIWLVNRLQVADAEILRSDGRVVAISVWKNFDCLSRFAFDEAYDVYLKNRNQWLEVLDQLSAVLWWVEEGAIPTDEETMERFSELDHVGPTQHAFNWQQPFDPLGGKQDSAN